LINNFTYLKKARQIGCILIKYEELLKSPFKILEKLEKKFKLTKKKKNFQDNEFYIGAGFTQSNERFNKSFYLKKEYLKDYTREQVDFITNLLNNYS